jgi:hypothetical protein
MNEEVRPHPTQDNEPRTRWETPVLRRIVTQQVTDSKIKYELETSPFGPS